jgi:hypothetical protein
MGGVGVGGNCASTTVAQEKLCRRCRLCVAHGPARDQLGRAAQEDDLAAALRKGS